MSFNGDVELCTSSTITFVNLVYLAMLVVRSSTRMSDKVGKTKSKGAFSQRQVGREAYLSSTQQMCRSIDTHISRIGRKKDIIV